LALSLSGLTLATLLGVGLEPLAAAIAAMTVLALGCASGGFGLVTWMIGRGPR
jgi:hypothetical protein